MSAIKQGHIMRGLTAPALEESVVQAALKEAENVNLRKQNQNLKDQMKAKGLEDGGRGGGSRTRVGNV